MYIIPKRKKKMHFPLCVMHKGNKDNINIKKRLIHITFSTQNTSWPKPRKSSSYTKFITYEKMPKTSCRSFNF